MDGVANDDQNQHNKTHKASHTPKWLIIKAHHFCHLVEMHHINRHRFLCHLYRCLRSADGIGAWWSCSYVGTPNEVQEYFQSRKRALELLHGTRARGARRQRIDSVVIENALKMHLYDPVNKMQSGASYLNRGDSEAVLDISLELMTELEAFLTARNVVTLASRLGRILACSETGCWMPHHQECVRALARFMKLALLKCNLQDLALMIWSIGKWGPRALSIQIDEHDSIHDLVLEILERFKVHGVKGNLDCQALSNLLNGLNHLNVSLNKSFIKLFKSKVKASIEHADSRSLTSVVLSMHELNFPLEDDTIAIICNTAETKMKAGNYPLKELLYFASALSQWQKQNPILHRFCEAFQQHIGTKARLLSPQDLDMFLKTLVNFRFFPRDTVLEAISYPLKEDKLASDLDTWISILRSYAEVGIKPRRLLDSLRKLIWDLDDDVQISSSAACNLLQSLCYQYSLEVKDLQTVWKKLKPQYLNLSETEKTVLYQAFLHLCHFTETDNDASILDEGTLKDLKHSWKMQEQFHRETMQSKFLTLQQKFPKDVEMKVVTNEDGDLIIFSLLWTNGTKYALFFDKETFQNKPQRFIGSALWKRRLLLKLGWQPIDVNPIEGISHLMAKIRHH